MAYVPIPKDLNAVKTKVLFNLTKRQLICFGIGLLIGLPTFFLLKSVTDPSTASLGLISILIPCFMFGIFERNGQPLEKLVFNMINTLFIKSKERPYIVNNYYSPKENTVEEVKNNDNCKVKQ